MVLNIYADLQGVVNIHNIINNWRNSQRPEKNRSILQLCIHMTGFAYELTTEEVEAPENDQKYQEIVTKVVETEFDIKKRFIGITDRQKIVKRFDLFAEALVKTFDNNTGGDWMHSLIKFTGELIENRHKMSDLVMIATFIRIVFVKHLMSLRARCEKEQEYLSSHAATMEALTDFCKRLFGSFSVGLAFKELHDMYVNVGLNLFRAYPEFLVLDWNQLEVFDAIFNISHMKTISQGFETLRILMEGSEIDDDETKEDVKMEISEFFENYFDSLFIDMVVHEKVTVSKEAFQLLILVQKFRGSSSPIIKDQETLTGVCESFLRDSKVIRSLSLEFMRLTMKPDAILNFILKCFEKYEIPLFDIVPPIFDREIFAQWDLYGTFLDNARNKRRSVKIVTQIVIQSLVNLTVEYQMYEKSHGASEIRHDSKIDVLEFLRVFPKFLFVYRVNDFSPESYTKMLSMMNGVTFDADLAQDVTSNCLNQLKSELFAALHTFETFSLLEKVTEMLLMFKTHFASIETEILDCLMEQTAIFSAMDENFQTADDIKRYKQAIYYVYVCLSKCPALLPDEEYVNFFNSHLEPMTSDAFLEINPVAGTVLSVITQILSKCFKIVVNTKERDMPLKTVEVAMTDVLMKMRRMMTQAIDSRVVMFHEMKLILINSANIMHYLAFRPNDSEIFTSTFHTIVKLTEMMLVHLDLPQFYLIFVLFYEVHHMIIQNHEEISHLVKYYGQPVFGPRLQKQTTRILVTCYDTDTSEEKKRFRSVIVAVIIAIADDDNITLFWIAFRKFVLKTLKMATNDFLRFIANMAFEILQQKLAIPRGEEDTMANRFEIFGMMSEIVSDMRKSTAVTTSVVEGFNEIQRKHERDFTEDENQSIKGFLREVMGSKRRRETQNLRI